MRTAYNHHFHDLFFPNEDSQRQNKIFRIKSSKRLNKNTHDLQANLLLKQYNKLRESSPGRRIDEEGRNLKHRKHSLIRDAENKQNKQINHLQLNKKPEALKDIVKNYFPLKAKREENDLSRTKGNIDTQTSSFDVINQSTPEQFRTKVKGFLDRTGDQTFEKTLKYFDESISAYKEKHSKDFNFNYHVLNLTEKDSLQEHLGVLESGNVRKDLKEKNLRIINRKPESKIDKILAQVNILDTVPRPTIISEVTEPNEANETMSNAQSYRSHRTLSYLKGTRRRTQRGNRSSTMILSLAFKNTSEEYGINKLKIPEIRQRLSSYNETIYKQLSSYKSLSLYKDIKKNEEIANVVEEAEKTLQFTKGTNQRRKELQEKFSQVIYKLIRKMKMFDLTMDNIIRQKALPTGPNERPEFSHLLKAIKSVDYSSVAELLILNKYLVYDYDQARKTALHWAAERNCPKIMRLLLEKGADPDSKDMMGRTPLFICAKFGFKNCVKLLLNAGGNPLIRSDAGNQAIDYANDPMIIKLLQKASSIHTVINGFAWKQYIKMWNNIDKSEFEVNERELRYR